MKCDHDDATSQCGTQDRRDQQDDLETARGFLAVTARLVTSLVEVAGLSVVAIDQACLLWERQKKNMLDSLRDESSKTKDESEDEREDEREDESEDERENERENEEKMKRKIKKDNEETDEREMKERDVEGR